MCGSYASECVLLDVEVNIGAALVYDIQDLRSGDEYRQLEMIIIDRNLCVTFNASAVTYFHVRMANINGWTGELCLLPDHSGHLAAGVSPCQFCEGPQWGFEPPKTTIL